MKTVSRALPSIDLSKFTWKTWLRLLVPAVFVACLLFWRIFLTPDMMFILLFIIFVVYGMAFEFIKLFSPFLGLLVSYDALRGIVPFVSKHVHYTTMIDFDRFLGRGQILTIRLQNLMYHGHLAWYDFYFYALYMAHFVTPVLLAVLIWRTRPKAYWRYVLSIVALSYAGFLTYIIFPAAPPWLASIHGYIPHIEKLSTNIWYAFGVHNFPTIYEKISPNEVAAVPSLHSAYPMLVTLFIWQLYGRRWGLLTSLYPLSMWLGVVYLGEHYLFDVIFGALYAVAAFVAVKAFYARRSRKMASKPIVAVPAPV